MISKMNSVMVMPPLKTYNAFGEQVITYPSNLQYAAEVAISVLNGNTQTNNNVKTVNSSHIGITYSNSINEKDRIQCGDSVYSVDFVNDAARLTVLYPQRVESYE